MIAPSKKPIPTARPTQAENQIPAADVRPFTCLPATRIVPAPRNPTPLITCAAILVMSAISGKVCSRYCSISITSVAPRQTVVVVLAPPPRRLAPLSIPIMTPSNIDTRIRIMTFPGVQIEKSFQNICSSPFHVTL